MAFILVTHKVRDFTDWKEGFDDHLAYRRQAGERSAQLFQVEGDPNQVILLLEWSSLAAARRFMESDNLRETMKANGVSDVHVQYMEEVGEDFCPAERGEHLVGLRSR